MEFELPNEILVLEFRTKLLAKIQDLKHDKFNEFDIQRIETDSKWLTRFILHQYKDIEKALQMAIGCLKWRQENAVRDISESSLPPELFVINGVYPFSRDKSGCKTLIIHTHLFKRNQHDFSDLKRYVIYWIEKMENEENNYPISLLFDVSNAGLINMQLELIKFLLSIFKDHYPWFLGYMYVYEMPKILTVIWTVVKPWLPSDGVAKVKFVNKETLAEYFNTNDLPSSMGGKEITDE